MADIEQEIKAKREELNELRSKLQEHQEKVMEYSEAINRCNERIKSGRLSDTDIIDEQGKIKRYSRQMTWIKNNNIAGILDAIEDAEKKYKELMGKLR